MHFSKSILQTQLSDNLDVLVMVVSGMIDVSTKLVFSDIAMAIVEVLHNSGTLLDIIIVKTFWSAIIKNIFGMKMVLKRLLLKSLLLVLFL